MRPFRAAAIVAIPLCALAVFGTPVASAKGEVVYVLDVSRSHGPGVTLLAERLRRWHGAGPHGGSRYRTIFAGSGAVAEGAVPPAFTEGSRVDLGLELARRSLGGARAVVVLSDGRFDPGPVVDQVRALAADGAVVSFAGPLAEPALDVRLVPRGAAVVDGGRARIRVGVAGTHREPRTVSVTVDGGLDAAGGSLTVLPGAVEEWEALVPVHQHARWITVRAALPDGPDAASANDAVVLPLDRPERRAVLVGGSGGGAERRTVAAALAAAAFEVDEPGDLATSAHVAGADLIVLVDQGLLDGGAGEMVAAVESAVVDGGVGLWVIGGEHSFQAGGYAASRIDPLLPLSSRAGGRRVVTVLLDASGSMEQDDRLGRAVEAITTLARSLPPEDRIQVIPFAQEAATPIPPVPAPPADFLRTATPELRRIAARGGTRLLPPLDLVLGRPPGGEAKHVLVVVTDARDDAASPDRLLERRRAMQGAKVESIVALLDATDETRARARILATADVVEVAELSPRILLEAVEPDSFVRGPIASRLAGGAAGPEVAWRNRVRAGDGALVALALPSGEPLMATAFRGVGRTAAWAAWPVLDDEAIALAREWALKTARPAAWKRMAARRAEGRLVVSLPPDSVPGGALAARIGERPERIPLVERTAGVFEAARDPGVGGYLAVLDGERTLGVVPLPPAGDPEYSWPAILPRGAGEPGGHPERLRRPWAALAALAWLAAVVLRRRAS